jgi:glycosyltransferase involved in cell wall biosynthesis
MSSGRGVLVYDVNTPWRERVFQALGAFRPVVGVAPQRLRIWKTKSQEESKAHKGYQRLRVPILPGWSRTFYRLHRSLLWRAGQRAMATRGAAVSAVVLTLPHHAPLLSTLDAGIKKIYYCPDYYPAYGHWDADWVKKTEASIVRQADAVICVSQALRRYLTDLDPEAADKIWVSPNGVDEEFLGDGPALTPEEPPWSDLEGSRPLLGCVGVFNERIDYALLNELALSLSRGALVLVGPLAPLPPGPGEEERRRLLAHPRVVAVGPQPHASLPRWLRAMDILLIPFAKSVFNQMCSPMRLFDYLASGRPIIGTTACTQLLDYKGHLNIARESDAFCIAVDAATKNTYQKDLNYERWHFAKSCLWSNRATDINNILISLSIDNK